MTTREGLCLSCTSAITSGQRRMSFLNDMMDSEME